ncbi:Inositol-1-monophosphatase [Aquisphaera giovannonii]|uniref:Inositol-1-monophosphatase n=1 Tax=Aquisphaera giovannonii TaxID=406548 RepID=A0A5B9VWE7_9BACT|nr:inositol monophosphatase family protein [Aquisphaera giovannonii]QEH32568.1 Inositol-1-monophosphatase [Aquisphaera giovannonii]
MAETRMLEEELEFVKALAIEAATLALERAGNVTPVEKANRSFVTDLDRDLEQLIRGRLKAKYPGDRITGEEYAAEGGTGPRRWSIDPIDGTGNMVHGLPLWAISIGLLDEGEPVLGVIAVPPLGELYWAVKGRGAWLDGERLVAEDSGSIHPQDNICVGTNAMRTLDVRTIPGRLRDLGSACCEQVFVAANRLKACVFLGEAAHDVAAGSVIVGEAGCRFARLGGEVLTPSEMVGRTPVPAPTFIAPPLRLEALVRDARLLPPRGDA